jgi:cytosine/adenosine deaminase-related metal-dependent hydrolase
MVRPLHIKNARVWNGREAEVRDLSTTDVVVEKPPLDALEVDLEGYTIFPGLINAHDHLELNHYPRSKFREVYNNAHEWGEDMNARLNTEPYKSLRAYPLWDRLFIGGLKNLLCGATTVAHHNPPHRELFRKDFPVRVLRKYGWAHSLHFSTEKEIVRSFRRTSKNTPWIIHLAEGTDKVARSELKRLLYLNCCRRENTVLVHGVGIELSNREQAFLVTKGLIWCPTTNLYLLGKTTRALFWVLNHRPIAIGSDSRLTAQGDLLDEMKEALSLLPGRPVVVVRMVTSGGVELLGLTKAGNLIYADYADFIVVRSGYDDAVTLCNSRRADLALVVKGGIPQIGDPEVMAKFSHIETVPAILDGKPKAIYADLAKRIVQCQLKEPGLEVDAPPTRRLFAVGR